MAGWSLFPLDEEDEHIRVSVPILNELKAATDERLTALNLDVCEQPLSLDDENPRSIYHYLDNIRDNIVTNVRSKAYVKEGAGDEEKVRLLTSEDVHGEGISYWIEDEQSGLYWLRTKRLNDLYNIIRNCILLRMNDGYPGKAYAAGYAYQQADKVLQNTKNEACDWFDDPLNASSEDWYEHEWPYIFRFGTYGIGKYDSLKYYMYGTRDWHGLFQSYIGDIDILNAYLNIEGPSHSKPLNLEWDGTPTYSANEKDVTFTAYAGTAAPTESFAGLRGYGNLIATKITNLYMPTDYENVLMTLDKAVLTKGAMNWIRMKSADIIDREPADLDWTLAPGYTGASLRGFSPEYGHWPFIYVEYDFDYV